MPQVCGAIDYIHIQVDFPANERSTDFFDEDKDYSFILRTIVDEDQGF